MKHMRTEQIPATTREVEDHVTCDMCGAEIKKGGNYEVDEVDVSHRVGNNYPEGGCGETTATSSPAAKQSGGMKG